MLLATFLLICSLALILFGATWLTDGGTAIAKRFGISELVIGLTIVAFGTSTPELVISVMSAIKGNAGIAIGNVVGSNIFNVLAIIGIVAMVRPIKVERTILSNDIPLVILASVALLACGNAMWLDGAAANVVTRVDGIMLLLFFAIFLRYTLSIAKEQPEPSPAQPQQTSAIEKPSAASPAMQIVKAAGMIVAGLGALIFGGNVFVDSATKLAQGFGISDAVIGLTVVAAGTSLPELATSVVAAVKGRQGIAVGNVIGSNLFNIFFVLGTASVVRPLPLGSIGNLDLLVMVGSAVIFWLFGWVIGNRTITRGEGALMVAGYVAYTAVLVAQAS